MKLQAAYPKVRNWLSEPVTASARSNAASPPNEAGSSLNASALQNANATQNEQQPDSPEGTSAEASVEVRRRRVALYLPAYAALAVAVGSAVFALTKTIGITDYTWKMWFFLALGLVFSCGLRCGSRTVQRTFSLFMIALILMGPPLAVFYRVFSFIPPDVGGDSNTLVTVIMGWVVVASLFTVGARYGQRPVPFVAPLVPTLSLYGLLNIVSVNTIVSVCFLTFVGASLYLTAYERLIERLEARFEDERVRSLRERDAGSTPSAGQREPLRGLPLLFQIRGAATGYLIASSVWFFIFVLGAGLFYIPLRKFLPTTTPPSFNNPSLYAQRDVGDWRNSPPVIELRGGSHVLSDREMLKITIVSGQRSGLWRGHVYERYSESRWKESTSDVDQRTALTAADVSVSLRSAKVAPTMGYTFSPQGNFNVSDLTETLRDIPAFDGYFNGLRCKEGECSVVVENVQPTQTNTSTVHSSGQPFAVQGALGEISVRYNGTATINDTLKRNTAYTVRSRIALPRTQDLNKARGLLEQELVLWRSNFLTGSTLRLTRDPERRAGYIAIAHRIEESAKKAGRPMNTPADKLAAVTRYITANCRYSLTSPIVPGDKDAVLFFLNESRLGACDMFASATIMLLRAMDVPARMVTGYLQPEDCQIGAACVVRERDAHAWIEYYVPAYGWLSDDPTSYSRTADEPEESTLALLLKWPTLTKSSSKWSVPLVTVLIALIGLTLGLRERNKRATRIPTSNPSQYRIASDYNTALRLLARRVPRPIGCTPQEYEYLVMRSTLPHNIKLEVTALTYLFTQSQYAPNSPNSNEALMHASLRRLRRYLRLNPHLLLPPRESFKRVRRQPPTTSVHNH
jgi:transglutaminase-like putative cysteine protease